MWREIFPLFDDVDKKEDSPSHHHRREAEVTRSIEQPQHGNGVVTQFLPGDIKGLEIKLNYL